MEPVETKEYKPGPIGKERSLKNRKAKDARGGEGEGLEGGVPGGVVSRAADSSPPTSDATVPELGGDIEVMITVPSAEYNSNAKVEASQHLVSPCTFVKPSLAFIHIVDCDLNDVSLSDVITGLSPVRSRSRTTRLRPPRWPTAFRQEGPKLRRVWWPA